MPRAPRFFGARAKRWMNEAQENAQDAELARSSKCDLQNARGTGKLGATECRFRAFWGLRAQSHCKIL